MTKNKAPRSIGNFAARLRQKATVTQSQRDQWNLDHIKDKTETAAESGATSITVEARVVTHWVRKELEKLGLRVTLPYQTRKWTFGEEREREERVRISW